MSWTVRGFEAADIEAVVALSLRAWDPVFSSMEDILGPTLSLRLHGDDWKNHQAGEVRRVVTDASMHVLVAVDHADQVVGFVATQVVDRDRGIGEVVMLAVDPSSQNRGVGLELTGLATAWLRGQGMTVAMIDTGGDPGHAPARHVYGRSGYTPLPVVRYFRAL